MNSHSWRIASVPPKTPTPIERAGLTEVPVAPMEAKWIIASERPMASGAMGRELVAGVGDAEDRHKKTRVISISSRKAAHMA